MRTETRYKNDHLKPRILQDLPGAILIDLDPDRHRSIPDLLILNGNMWAMLETKRATNSARQPNQDYYVDYYNKLGFAMFIDPMVEDTVLLNMYCYFVNRQPNLPVAQSETIRNLMVRLGVNKQVGRGIY